MKVCSSTRNELRRVHLYLCRVRNAEYRELLDQNDASDDYDQKSIQLQRQRRLRQENTLEAQIQPGDTLQAIALRYNCTVSVDFKESSGNIDIYIHFLDMLINNSAMHKSKKEKKIRISNKNNEIFVYC